MLRYALGLFAFYLAIACGFARGEAPLSPGEHTTLLNGVRLWYRVAGKAHAGRAPLIFLAGGPGYNTYSFEKTIGSELEQHLRMIYFDQRGTGRSERPPSNDYAMSHLVQDIESLRNSFGIHQISLMGHSFGATVAVEYAARHPEHVQKLIVVDGAENLPQTLELWSKEIQDKDPTAWGEALRSESSRALLKARAKHDACAATQALFSMEVAALGKVDGAAFHNWQQFHDQQYQKQQAGLDKASGLRNTGEISKAYFSPGSKFLCYHFTDYSKLTMPTLVIVGKYDGAVGVEQMRSFAKRLPHAQFDEFANSAHFPYAEEPAKFEHDVTAFLQHP